MTTETERRARQFEEILPPYAVILFNDEVHSMHFVVAALLKSVPQLTAERAVEVMLEAHNTGRSVVIVCPLEAAELYRDRLHGFGLGSAVEPA